MMARAAHPLHSARDRRRRLNLHHQINRAHINSQFERRGGHQSPQRAELQLVFNLLALPDGHAAVMRAHQYFAGKIVEGSRNSLREPSVIHKNQSRTMRFHQLQQFGMDRAPDRMSRRALRGRPTRNFFNLVELRHIFHRHFHTQIETFRFARIHNRDGAMHRQRRRRVQVHDQPFGGFFVRAAVCRLPCNIHAAQIMRDFLQWTLRC